MEVAEVIQRLRVKCNNYDQTVQAIKALAHELLWDDNNKELVPGGTAFVGRRMDTSPTNRVSPSDQVTPDLVVRRTPIYGVVAEAKLALSSSAEQRRDTIVGVQKYDDDLRGWDTSDGLLKQHDVLMIVQHFHGKQVQEEIAALRKEGALQFQRNFGLLCFAIVEEEQVWMSLELLEGSLADKGKTAKLSRRLPLALEHVAANPLLGAVTLYDAEPPYPLLMDRIHEAVLSELDGEEHLQLREEGLVEKRIQVRDLRGLLSDLFGPGQSTERVPEIPRASWVEKALRLFVKLGWSKRIGEGRYVYLVKNRRRPLEQFLKVCARDSISQAEHRQKLAADMPLLKDQIEDASD